RVFVFEQGDITGAGLMVLGDKVGEVLRDGVVFYEHVGGPFEQGQEEGAQPLTLGGADRVRSECAGGAPLSVDFAEFAGQVRRVLDQTLREDLAEYRQTEERAGDFNELEQFGVLGGGRHQASPSGTRKVTATGNRRGCGSA